MFYLHYFTFVRLGQLVPQRFPTGCCVLWNWHTRSSCNPVCVSHLESNKLSIRAELICIFCVFYPIYNRDDDHVKNLWKRGDDASLIWNQKAFNKVCISSTREILVSDRIPNKNDRLNANIGTYARSIHHITFAENFFSGLLFRPRHIILEK